MTRVSSGEVGPPCLRNGLSAPIRHRARTAPPHHRSRLCVEGIAAPRLYRKPEIRERSSMSGVLGFLETLASSVDVTPRDRAVLSVQPAFKGRYAGSRGWTTNGELRGCGGSGRAIPLD